MVKDSIIETFDLTKRFEVSSHEDVGYGLEYLSRLVKRKLFKRERRFTVAVDRVNLKVERGEFFGLLGPNGAGKTTLLKLLAAILYPDEGTAYVNGYDIRKERRQVRSSINIIVSGGWLGFNWWLSVEQNLKFFGRLYGLPKKLAEERTNEALKILGLEEHRNEVPFYLSSGMRQKLLLGKAFLLRSPILFLDEPTIGLDPKAAYTVRQFVKEKLNKEYGMTVLMSTHYMEEAEMLCDRVAIMDEGRIVAVDTPDNLKKLVKKGEFLEIKAANMTPELIKKIEGLEFVEDVVTRMINPVLGISVIRIHTSNSRALMPELTHILQSEGVQIRFIRNIEPTLEDVFMNMTGKRLREG